MVVVGHSRTADGRRRLALRMQSGPLPYGRHRDRAADRRKALRPALQPQHPGLVLWRRRPWRRRLWRRRRSGRRPDDAARSGPRQAAARQRRRRRLAQPKSQARAGLQNGPPVARAATTAGMKTATAAGTHGTCGCSTAPPPRLLHTAHGATHGPRGRSTAPPPRPSHSTPGAPAIMCVRGCNSMCPGGS
eukprot:scaffold129733_cov69-Phaeocystis_antarctica.AAC.10